MDAGLVPAFLPDFTEYCSACAVPLGSLQAYAEHLKHPIHQQQDPDYWKCCRPCNIALSEHRAYVEHLKTIKHRNAVEDQAATTLGRPFACTQCAKRFTRDRDRRRHEKTQHINPVKPESATPAIPAKRGREGDAPLHEVFHPDDSLMDLDGTDLNPERSIGIHVYVLPTIAESLDESVDLLHELTPSPHSIDYHTEIDSGVDLATPVSSFELSSGSLNLHQSPMLRPNKTTSLPRRSRSVLEGAFPKRYPPPAVRQHRCHICRQHYNNDTASILAHMKTHEGEFAKHVCEVCEVGFQHVGDLIYHRKCALEGNCGFRFKHTAKCTGHHPPTEYQPPESFPDHDRFKLGYLLRDWEGAQLHMLMESIDLLPTSEDMDSYRWSQDVRKRPWSLISLPASLTSFRSTPKDVDYDAKGSAAATEARLRRFKPGAMVNRIWVNRKRQSESMNSKRQAELVEVATDAVLLRQAIENGDLVALRQVLAKGYPVNKPLTGAKYEYPYPVMTPLDLAAIIGRLDVSLCLLEHGATLWRPDVDNFLVAVAQGNTSVAHSLLQYGWIDANTRDDTGRTALHLAVDCGSSAILDLLVERGANVNALDYRDGQTPLHSATVQGHHDLVWLLLRHGADQNLIDHNGQTAFEARMDYASLDRSTSLDKLLLLGELGCATLLLESGTSIGHRTSGCTLADGRTLSGAGSLIIVCFEQDSTDAIRLLLKYNTQVEPPELRSALEYALGPSLTEEVRKERMKLAELLFDARRPGLQVAYRRVFSSMMPKAVECQLEWMLELWLSQLSS